MGTGQPGFGNSPRDLTTGQPYKPASSGTGNTKPAAKPKTPPKRDKAADDKMTAQMLAWADRKEEEDKLLDILVPYIRTRATQMLDQWLIQAVSAKGDANSPPEESNDSWILGLAGNLLWAASCFLPGAGVVKAAAEIGGMTKLGKVFYATMSVGGAVIGGAAGQIITGPDGAPTGKDFISDALNDKRSKMGKDLNKNIEPWARDIIRTKSLSPSAYQLGRERYLEAVDQVLWSNIFPDIDHEDYKAIYGRCLRAINAALGNFNRQYKQWTEMIQSYTEHAIQDADPRCGRMYSCGGYDYAKKREEMLKRYPFRPLLHFSPEP